MLVNSVDSDGLKGRDESGYLLTGCHVVGNDDAMMDDG